MIRILEVIPDPADGTSWYRGRLPNSMLEKSGEIMFIPTNPEAELRWSELAKCAMVFMQRPTNTAAVNTIINARRLKVPVWIDYDDLLISLPDDNEHKAAFDASKKNIQLLLDNASIITCSTPFLAIKMASFGGSNFEAIPNAWADNILGWPQRMSETESVFWRGSGLHQRDLFLMTNAAKEISEKVPFNMVGHKPWFYDFAVSEHKYQGILEYFAMLSGRSLGRVCVVSLADNPFNRSKSNNAWMEATYAGSVVVAPKFPEWQRPGILNYSDYDEMRDTVFHLLENRDMAYNLWSGSANFIKENLSLDKINAKRMMIIKKFAK